MSPDIQSRIRRDFPPHEFFSAIEAIHDWDAERKGLLEDRLIRCAVFLANGSIDTLKHQIRIALADYRDLIAAAEYEGDIHARDFSRPFTTGAKSA